MQTSTLPKSTWSLGLSPPDPSEKLCSIGLKGQRLFWKWKGSSLGSCWEALLSIHQSTCSWRNLRGGGVCHQHPKINNQQWNGRQGRFCSQAWMSVAVTRYHELILFWNLQGNGLCGPTTVEEQFWVFRVNTSSQSLFFSHTCAHKHTCTHTVSGENTAPHFACFCYLCNHISVQTYPPLAWPHESVNSTEQT